jgi:hypothetical protein
MKSKTRGATEKEWNTRDGKQNRMPLPIYLPIGLFDDGIRKAMNLKNTDRDLCKTNDKRALLNIFIKQKFFSTFTA